MFVFHLQFPLRLPGIRNEARVAPNGTPICGIIPVSRLRAGFTACIIAWKLI